MKTFYRLLISIFIAMTAFAGRQRDESDLDILFRKIRNEPANPVYQEDLKAMMPKIASSNELQLALAVYSLGRLANEDYTGAQTARDSLAKHFPNSPYFVNLKQENLTAPCHRCEGDGKTKSEACDHCNGSRKCTACSGRGFIQQLNKQKKPCPGCNGTGHCHYCNGTGRTPGDCPVCHGRGTVLDLRKVRATIHGLLDPYRGKNEPAASEEK